MPTLERIRVALDEGPTFTAWTTGQTWNGWACPMFEFDEAVRVAAFMNEISNDNEGLRVDYDAKRDCFVVTDPADDEGGVDHVEAVERDGMTLYPIGSMAWTWNRVHDPA